MLAKSWPIVLADGEEAVCQTYDPRADKVCGKPSSLSVYVASKFMPCVIDMCPECIAILEAKLLRSHNQRSTSFRHRRQEKKK